MTSREKSPDTPSCSGNPLTRDQARSTKTCPQAAPQARSSSLHKHSPDATSTCKKGNLHSCRSPAPFRPAARTQKCSHPLRAQRRRRIFPALSEEAGRLGRSPVSITLSLGARSRGLFHCRWRRRVSSTPRSKQAAAADADLEGVRGVPLAPRACPLYL